MKTFSIYTLGCKVNQYESQQVRELLENHNLRKAEHAEKPDLVVVNTCCVTHTASAKSRQQIHKIQKHHPEAILVVCGCLPVITNNLSASTSEPVESLASPELTGVKVERLEGQPAGQAENTLFVTKRDELAAILIQLTNRENSLLNFQADLSNDRHTTADFSPQSINLIKTENDSEIKSKNGFSENQDNICSSWLVAHDSNIRAISPESQVPSQLPLLTRFKYQTRAFLKVQDGCDGFCTYCIIPKTRPQISSKPINQAVDEAKMLVHAGHKEIVITGICLGAYGRETTRTSMVREASHEPRATILPDLVEKIAQIPHLDRIRLSSIEPSDITERLLDIFCTYPNIMPHIHLSLQSGSDAVLKKMCRKYKIDEVRKKIERINSLLDKPAITTDIIVGFPGETDENFEETVKFVKEAGFAKIHVFRFSPRKGTPAARMKNPVDNKIINLRSKILRELDEQSGLNFRSQFIGKYEAILIENNPRLEESSDKSRVTSHVISGRSERYFMVHLRRPESSDLKYKFKKNDIVKVKLLQNTKDAMIGDPCY